MKLRYYVAVRLLLIIPTMLIILSTVFFLMHVLPGDPVRMLYGDKVPEEFVQQVRHQWGLDKPISEQFVNYMIKVASGNLGVSLVYKIDVLDKIKQCYPTTLELAIGGILLSVIVGIPLGIISSINKDGKIDNLIKIITLYLYSNPTFWLALLCQLYLGVMLGILPILGRSPTAILHNITGMPVLDALLALDFRAFTENFRFMILPWFVTAMGLVPRLVRMTRAAMLNVLGEDYITTARAKGLTENIVFFRHALRNAILPIVTIVGTSFAFLMGGTVITEQIFALPGIGRLLFDSLSNRDFEMIQGIVIVFSIIIIFVNTFTDVTYAIADPRVEY